MSLNMPKVDPASDFPAALAAARKMSAGEPSSGAPLAGRAVAIITPGRLVMKVPCPPAETVSPQMIEAIRAIVPEIEPQTVTVVAFNDLANARALDPSNINKIIPFTGYLLGMAFVGHNVVVFEGHPSAFEAGCAGADLLMIDEAMAGNLQDDWFAVATRVMRRCRVLVFHRNGQITPVDESTPEWIHPGSVLKRRRKWWPF